MNLSMRYLGLDLAHPVVPAASPLTATLDGIRQLEDAGAPAVTLLSVFEEQIEHEAEHFHLMVDYSADSYAEAQSYFPAAGTFAYEPEGYLELVRKAKRAIGIPVIASLNGVSTGGWVKYARLIQEAGADALELNVYWIETRTHVSSSAVEDQYVGVVEAVCRAVTIPVAVKIGPFFASPGHLVRRFALAGAQGVVLFNRFYEPDFDIDHRRVQPGLALSSSDDLRLPLHWTAILSHAVPAVDYAISSGVHTSADVIKSVLAGAKVATCASSLLMYGPEHLKALVGGVRQWMDEQGIDTLSLLRGTMNTGRIADPSAFLRANYMKELQSFRPMPVTVRR